MKPTQARVKLVGVNNANVVPLTGGMLRSVPISGPTDVQPGDLVELAWIGERPYVTGILTARTTEAAGAATTVPSASSDESSGGVYQLDLVIDTDDGQVLPDENTVEILGGDGIITQGSAKTVSIVHDTVASGDLHQNYPEMAVDETITADWLWGTTKKVQFRDAAIYIQSGSDGDLDLVADAIIHLFAPVLDIDAASGVSVSNNLQVGGSVGIGTTTPRRYLDVLNNAAPQMRLTHTDNSIYTDFKTTADGYLEITPTGGKMRFNMDLEFVGAQSILTDADALTIAPATDLILDPTGNDVLLYPDVTISSSDWTSGLTGWGISYAGVADFRTIYADELIVETFQANNLITLAGALIITKSRARLSRDFVVPAMDEDGTLYVEDLEGWDNVPVFAAGDYIRLRYLNTSGGGLIVTDVWGSVSSYADLTGGEQSWTFTCIDDGGAESESILAGQLALDYGQTASGSRGIWEATVLDAAGAPYSQVATWVTNPWTPANWTVNVRTGNLDGLAGVGQEYGLYVGQNLTTTYLLLSDTHFEIHGIDLSIHSGGNTTIRLNPGTPYFSLGTTAPTGFLVGDGIWMGYEGISPGESGTYADGYKFRVGDIDGERLQWDSTALEIYDGAGLLSFKVDDSGTWLTSLAISSDIGDMLFSKTGGLLLLNPQCQLVYESPSYFWVSPRRQKATITGAVRQVQGRWLGTKAIDVQPSTTNLCTNPSVEVDTTNWVAASSTVTRITTDYVFGSACAKVVTTAAANAGVMINSTNRMSVTAGQTYTASVYARSGGASFSGYLRIVWYDSGGSLISASSASVTISPTWARLAKTATAPVGATTAYVDLIQVDATARTYYADCVQFENNVAATSYCDGSFGFGFAWTGTANASTSTRGAAEISLDSYTKLVSNNNTMSIRLVAQMPWAATDAWPNGVYLFDFRNTTANCVYLYYDSTNGYFIVYINGGTRITTAVQSFSAGDWLDIILTLDFTGDSYILYINGVEAGSSTASLTAPTGVAYWSVGSAYNATLQGIAVAEYAVFDSVLTQDQVYQIYLLQRPLVDMGAGDGPHLSILDGRFTIASSSSGVRLEIDNDSISIGNGISYTGVGCWLGLDGGTPKFSLYVDATHFFRFDGASLEWNVNGTTMSTAGAITCTSGTIGGWDLGTYTLQSTNDYITLHSQYSGNGPYISIGAATDWQSKGIQLQYNSGNPRFYCGQAYSGGTEYIMYDGSKIEIRTGGGYLRFNDSGFQFDLGGGNIGIVWKDTFSSGKDCAQMRYEPSGNVLRLVSGGSGETAYPEMAFQQEQKPSTTLESRVPLRLSGGTSRRIGVYDSSPAGVLSVRGVASGSGGEDLPVLYLEQRYTGGSNQPVAVMDQGGSERTLVDYVGLTSGSAGAQTVQTTQKTSFAYAVKFKVNGNVCYLNFFT